MIIGVIDDDLVYKFVVRTLIGRTSPTSSIIELNDGQEAIEFINQNKYQLSALPDIILLDINMPRLNGWQFLDQLRDSSIAHYSPSIYMVSSSSDIGDITMARTYKEITRLISKPIPLQVIREILSQANTGH
ncbi:response regulator [Dyadobacter psychrotolerans]|uniref:Response regulator n=1 Tax=Dyadobacter psychrotolerans TaxID=2541721 RepID=A0A4R5DB24_9BACT|nr:response regulator [Dyadobacter psychrotolerans]TDE09001.1 response regulator [Dyadobacter psychrotolerans]